MTVQDCMDCAELQERIYKLEDALRPFVGGHAGLHFDIVKNRAIVKCRYCLAWAGELAEFQHDSQCPVTVGKRLLE
jgi:hypothetical protein